MPASGRSGRDEFLQAHIPGARFLDIDALSDKLEPGAAHAARRGELRQRRWRRSASGATTASSSMTIRRCGPRRAAGSCCAISARRRSRSSTAVSRNGWRRAGRSKAASQQPRHARFDAVERAGEGGHQSRRARRRGHAARCARQGPVRGQRARSAAGRRAGPYPGSRATCLTRRSTMTTARSAAREELRRLFDGSGRRSDAAVRRHLRVGRHRQFADLRRASARQRRGAALRWQLERVGRRPGDAQGDRSGLARISRSMSSRPARSSSASSSSAAGLRRRRSSRWAEHGFEAGSRQRRPAPPSGGRSSAARHSLACSQPPRARVEVEVRRRPPPNWSTDAQRVADAGEAAHRLGRRRRRLRSAVRGSRFSIAAACRARDG